jgi:hypothetical protein
LGLPVRPRSKASNFPMENFSLRPKIRATVKIKDLNQAHLLFVSKDLYVRNSPHWYS